MNKQEPRIVIRRKRSHVSVKHNDSWKIAYADFVTAMMAFFLIMWLVALVPQKDLQEMAEYFRMPLMTAVKGGPKNDTGSSVIPSGNPSIIPNPSPIASRGDARTEGDLRDVDRLENLKAELEVLIETDPILQQFRPQLLLEIGRASCRVRGCQNV